MMRNWPKFFFSKHRSPCPPTPLALPTHRTAPSHLLYCPWLNHKRLLFGRDRRVTVRAFTFILARISLLHRRHNRAETQNCFWNVKRRQFFSRVHASLHPALSVGRSVCHTLLFCDFQFWTSLLLPKWSSDLKYGTCPPARDFGSRVSGLVLK